MLIDKIGKIGLGTNAIGRSDYTWREDIFSVRYAFEVGYRVIDTAEMYEDGRTEELLGIAIEESKIRDSLFIVSKVMPKNARTKQAIIDSVDKSLARLNCDYLDSYLLHWREEGMSLEYILETFLDLQQRGKIKTYGISNFRQNSFDEWCALEKKLEGNTSFHQIRYSILYPNFQDNIMLQHVKQNITTMAWRPLDDGSVFKDDSLIELSKRCGYSVSQLALAWAIRDNKVIAIPKSSKKERLKENFEASNLKLDDNVLQSIHRLQMSKGKLLGRRTGPGL